MHAQGVRDWSSRLNRMKGAEGGTPLGVQDAYGLADRSKLKEYCQCAICSARLVLISAARLLLYRFGLRMPIALLR